METLIAGADLTGTDGPVGDLHGPAVAHRQHQTAQHGRIAQNGRIVGGV